MDDSFLLSKRNASVSEMEAVLRAAGYERVVSSGAGITVFRDDLTILVNITQIECDEVPEDDVRKMRSLGIVSIFCVSHHPRDSCLMRPLLKALLHAFDGCIGNDDDGFEPIFTLEDLESGSSWGLPDPRDQ